MDIGTRTENNPTNDHLPRWKFRKQRKLAARRAHRQRNAQARDQKKGGKEEKELEAHSIYLQQKRQWEERERRYDMINLAKKRAAEAERLAKEATKREWRDALLRMPMLPPAMRGSDQHPIRNHPQFVSSSSSSSLSSHNQRSRESLESDEPCRWP